MPDLGYLRVHVWARGAARGQQAFGRRRREQHRPETRAIACNGAPSGGRTAPQDGAILQARPYAPDPRLASPPSAALDDGAARGPLALHRGEWDGSAEALRLGSGPRVVPAR